MAGGCWKGFAARSPVQVLDGKNEKREEKSGSWLPWRHFPIQGQLAFQRFFTEKIFHCSTDRQGLSIMFSSSQRGFSPMTLIGR